MKTAAELTGLHLRTYETIFQHPVSHNLRWHDVHALFRQLGVVEQAPHGALLVTRNGETILLQPARTKDVAETDELMSLRHFLQRSEPAAVEARESVAPWLLVINHHEARIFRSESAGTACETILPHTPDDFFRHTQDSREFARGQEKPDPNSFFEPVARALAGAARFIVFGTGTGMSSEMDQFIAWLKSRHADLAQRIVASAVVDEHHLTVGELLAKAREFRAPSGLALV
jgi:hypothetical protein